MSKTMSLPYFLMPLKSPTRQRFRGVFTEEPDKNINFPEKGRLNVALKDHIIESGQNNSELH